MKEQIARLFHNMIRQGAGRIPQEETGSGQERNADLTASAPPVSGDTMGRMLADLADQKAFSAMIDEILQERECRGGFLIVDVDRFKEVNNTYGHEAGDDVLQNVVDLLQDVFCNNRCFGRLGGDTFALWVPEPEEDKDSCVRHRIAVINDRLLHPDRQLPPVSLSAGLAYCEEGDDCRSLGRRAVRAMNRVKECGRCGFEVYGENIPDNSRTI